MRKKNSSGFTLVELIVVIALLTIMMGAILQLMDPIRNIYRDTYDTVNTKTTGETMISYIEDKVRYSTNVLVLDNYVGVPQITPIPGKKSAKVGNSKYEYTNVIVIDNTNIRGSMFSDYKGDTGTPYARKGCKGTIYEIKNIGESDVLDLTKASGGTIGDNIYGDYTHQIDLNVSKEKMDPSDSEALAYLDINIHSTPMKAESGSYVMDEENSFDASRSFDLVNVNLNVKKGKGAKDSYSVEDPIDFDVTPAKYTDFPRQLTYPAGLTTEQARYFDDTLANNKYTYIFFVIKDLSADKCEVSFQYSKDDPSSTYAGKFYDRTFDVVAGNALAKSEVETMNSLPARTGCTGYYFTDGTSKIDLSTYIINDDTTFTIVYTTNADAVSHTAIFKMPDGSTQEGSFDNGSSVNGTPDPDGFYDPITEYVIWKEETTGTLAENYSVTTHSSDGVKKADSVTVYYVPEVVKKYVVKFKLDDGTYLDDSYNQYIKEGTANDPGYVVTPPEGKVFAGWYSEDTNVIITSLNINKDTIFVPKFTDQPTTPSTPSTPSGGESSEDPTSDSHNVIIHIVNPNPDNNSIAISGSKADFEVSGDLSYSRTADYYTKLLEGQLKSGQTFTIKYYSDSIKLKICESTEKELNKDAEFWFDYNDKSENGNGSYLTSAPTSWSGESGGGSGSTETPSGGSSESTEPTLTSGAFNMIVNCSSEWQYHIELYSSGLDNCKCTIHGQQSDPYVIDDIDLSSYGAVDSDYIIIWVKQWGGNVLPDGKYATSSGPWNAPCAKIKVSEAKAGLTLVLDGKSVKAQ